MDFRIDADEDALRRAVRTYCEEHLPFERVREIGAQPSIDRALWSGLAELGVFGLRSLGLGATEAVLVFGELGRALAPGPLAFTYLAADRVSGAAEGRLIVSGVDLENGRSPLLVEHLAGADVLWALDAHGVRAIDPRAVEAHPLDDPFDPLTHASVVSSLPEGERIGDRAEADRLRLWGAALVAAQLFGIAEATGTLAVAYAKMREQFGRPIGSFQAIKHIAADMFVRQELARAAVHAAAAALDHPETGDAASLVSGAYLIASRAADKNARACLQIHGGMGYTWEMPVHYYLKRAWVLRTQFGPIEEHAERIAATLDPIVT